MKRLFRSSDDCMIGGVCGGLGEYFNIDSSFIRIALVITTLFGWGVPGVIYIICWIVLPEN